MWSFLSYRVHTIAALPSSCQLQNLRHFNAFVNKQRRLRKHFIGITPSSLHSIWITGYSTSNDRKEINWVKFNYQILVKKYLFYNIITNWKKHPMFLMGGGRDLRSSRKLYIHFRLRGGCLKSSYNISSFTLTTGKL